MTAHTIARSLSPAQKRPVDDAALIAEAERLADMDVTPTSRSMSAYWTKFFAAHLIRLERTGWKPPAPELDRAELLAKDLWENGSGPSLNDWKTIIRRHLSELRAKWEAERPVIDVPEDILWICKNGASVSRAHPNSHEGMMRDFILSRVRRAE